MKTIASLQGPDFLRACNHTRHAVAKFLQVTNVTELRKRLPKIPEGATEQERQQLLETQGKKNFEAMLDLLLEEQPEATYELLLSLMVLEDGEQPDGFDLIAAGMELLCTPKVLDFFTRLAKLVL